MKLSLSVSFFLVSALCFGKTEIIEKPSFQINVTENGSTTKIGSQTSEIEVLKARILLLEKAVQELQIKVYGLQNQAPVQPESKMLEIKEEETTWTCFLRDSFGNVFSGTGRIKEKAAGVALTRCSSGVNCMSSKLECSSEKKETKMLISQNALITYQTTKQRQWACYIQDNLHKTHLGEGPTEAEAKTQVFKSCGSSVNCPANKIVCGHD